MSKHPFHHMSEREESRLKVSAALKQKLAADLNLSPVNREKKQPRWRSLFSMPAMGAVGALILVIAVMAKPAARVPSMLGLAGVDDWNPSAEQSELNDLGVGAVQSSISLGSSPSLGSQLAAGLKSAAASLSAPAQPMHRSAPSGYAPIQANDLAASAIAPAGNMEADALGYAVGGAKDIGNFRENIEKGFTPLSTDLTYEGLFYDYFFDTGIQKPCTELFCPSYARAVTHDPQTGAEEYYLSVGLNSNIKEKDFRRPKTNFVVVLDISGSMGEAFDQYYYDGNGQRVEIAPNEASKTKMRLASESLSALVDQLKPDDRLGIVLFSDSAAVAKPLNLVGDTDRVRLKQHLMELQATNGTNMSAGLEKGAALLRDQEDGKDGYANRMIFITDAMPNEGEFSAGGLEGLVQRNEEKGIGMTLIGIGVDFQSQLVEALTKVRGANYLSVHSSEDFKQRLGEQFDFLVTPLVYDLRLSLEGSGFAIDKVYGSPDADLSSGEVMHVRTLFPSKTENGQTRGGLVLLKLKKISDSSTATLRASYEDTSGKSHQNDATVSLGEMRADTYDNLGIRKGVLLARYGELMKDWLVDENGHVGDSERTRWERSSHPLHVSSAYQLRFSRFTEYFRTESTVINDKTLDQEQAILNRLAKTTTVVPQRIDDDWVR